MSSTDKRGGRNSKGGPSRHPSHLKGKEIGLYYARLNKKRKVELGREDTKVIGTVSLSPRWINYFTEQINLNSNFLLKSNRTKGDNYEHVSDSRFKRDFMRVINETIDMKLDQDINEIECDEEIDLIYYKNELEKQKNSKYCQYLEKRKKLPSYQMKEQILKLIDDNQIIVISGETGCGKTTQIPQFILESYLLEKKGSLCNILCTQPRRISAISVAERVAEERAERLGESVGYQIRLEYKKPSRLTGTILFCTTGIVLKLMETNPSLSNISHLIIDEIHERDILSDFILALIKEIIKKRKDLKIILMSATLNAEKFSKYYNNAPHINIPGFTYPVQEYYLEDIIERTKYDFNQSKTTNSRKSRNRSKDYPNELNGMIQPYLRQLEIEKTYSQHVLQQLRNPDHEKLDLDLILALIKDICQKDQNNGAILVFLTGFSEISTLITLMEKSGDFPHYKYNIYPLHSLMPTINQKQIFLPPSKGVRKIIVSTNIAETSITIDDVLFVIDCGRIKITSYNLNDDCAILSPQWVSLANAQQRKGRAGRVRSGECYHFYTKIRESLLDKFMKPEILRTRLEDVILTAKVLQLGRINQFFPKLIDCPDSESIDRSLNLLKQLNALSDDESLTPLGYHLAKLPLSPQMGKMLLFGSIFSCLEPILSIIATLDFKDPFQLPIGKENLADKKRLELADGIKSDHLLYYNVMKRFEECGRNYQHFCYENFISSHTMKLLIDMRRHLAGYLKDMCFIDNLDPKCSKFNQNSDNESLIKAIVCAGLYPNVLIKKGKKHLYTPDHKPVAIHRKSVLYSAYLDTNLVVYYNRIKTDKDSIHDGTLINPLPVIFFGDNYQHINENGRHMIIINKQLKFKCKEETANIIKEIREQFNWFWEYKISHPGPIDWTNFNGETRILQNVLELITMEDTGGLECDFDDDRDNDDDDDD